MGLFTPNFTKPGPGIEKDAPPKKGLALFFEILFREFWELIKLNLLFVLTCLPIVTIGAAIGAMTKVTVLMVRDIPKDVWFDYWRGFRENWKAGTVLSIVGGILFSGGLLGLIVYQKLAILQIISIALLMMLATFWIYLYPLATSTTLPMRAVIQDALTLSILRFHYSLPVSLLVMALLILQVGFFPLSFPIMLLFGFSFPNFIASFTAWRGIEKFVLSSDISSSSVE